MNLTSRHPLPSDDPWRGRPIRVFDFCEKHANYNVRNRIIKCLPLLYNRSLAVTDTAPRFWCRRGYSRSFAVIVAETALFHIMTSSLTMKNLRLVAKVKKIFKNLRLVPVVQKSSKNYSLFHKITSYLWRFDDVTTHVTIEWCIGYILPQFFTIVWKNQSYKRFFPNSG